MNGQEKTGGEIFIVDNSDETWRGLKYLQDWAEIAIIISQVLPKGIETFGFVDGIWLAQPQAALPVAVTMRCTRIEIATARLGLHTRTWKSKRFPRPCSPSANGAMTITA